MCLSQGRWGGGAAGTDAGAMPGCWRALYGVGTLGLAGHLLFFLQTFQQELDTVVNTQHEILRQVNEMK